MGRTIPFAIIIDSGAFYEAATSSDKCPREFFNTLLDALKDTGMNSVRGIVNLLK